MDKILACVLKNLDELNQNLSLCHLDQGYREAIQICLPKINKEYSKGINKLNLYFLALPTLCCKAIGGIPENALNINSAWMLLYLAFHLLDKIEDNEIENLVFTRFPENRLINITTGCILYAELFLDFAFQEEVRNPDIDREIRVVFNQMALKVCSGQHLDLSIKKPTLKQAWQITEAKSGDFFALACSAGSRLATDCQSQIEEFKKFGSCLGILLQIANDINGLWSLNNHRSDIVTQKHTLPIAYAYHILSPKECSILDVFFQLAEKDEKAEKQARGMIIECGSLIYLYLEMEKMKNLAIKTLVGLSLQQSSSELFDLLHMVSNFSQIVDFHENAK